MTDATAEQGAAKASEGAMLVAALVFFVILPGLPLTGLPGTAEAYLVVNATTVLCTVGMLWVAPPRMDVPEGAKAQEPPSPIVTGLMLLLVLAVGVSVFLIDPSAAPDGTRLAGLPHAFPAFFGAMLVGVTAWLSACMLNAKWRQMG
jgi:hypothetical protein